MTGSDAPPETQQIHCNECGHKTKHELIARRHRKGSERHDVYSDISWDTIYEMFECCGCQDVTLRRKFYFSEWNLGDVEIRYYPPRIARRLPKWIDAVPDELTSLLNEVYAALHADSPRLAMMGARAVIDMVMVDRIGDAGNFAGKLKKMQQDGYLSDKNRQVLEAAVDVGNAASHRGHRPKRTHVEHVMDIVENLLQATHLQKDVADELRAGTPPRTTKRKPNQGKKP